MFLDFPMDPKLRPYSGIDLTPVGHQLGKFSVSKGQQLWMRWNPLFMGMKPSPFFAVRYAYLAEELARGPPADPSSPFRFDHVRFNIPGQTDYDPSLPWVLY